LRIILPDHRVDGGLPIAQLLAGNNIDLTNFVSVADAVEVSRFAISKDSAGVGPMRPPSPRGGRCRARKPPARRILACLSLIQFLLRQCVERGVVYWTAVMEATFLRHAGAHGGSFHRDRAGGFPSRLPPALLLLSSRHAGAVAAGTARLLGRDTNGGELSQRMALVGAYAHAQARLWHSSQ